MASVLVKEFAPTSHPSLGCKKESYMARSFVWSLEPAQKLSETADGNLGVHIVERAYTFHEMDSLSTFDSRRMYHSS